MKKIVSMILSLTLILSMIPQLALAEEPGEYEGKTVVVYTGNLRGDIDKYPKVAAAKKAFLDEDADKVLLVDAGNYMQGTRFANSDRGKSIYSLMDASGYDVAAMGSYEFVYGNGGVGNPYHQASYKKFPSQSELAENVGFTVISSNLNGPGTSGNYDFDENKIVKVKGKRIGFVAQTDENTPDMVQDGFMAGCEFGDVSLPKADVVIGLSNNGKAVDGATATISAPTDGEEVIGAYVIDTENKTAEEIKDFNVDSYTPDADVAREVDSIKNSADPKIGDSDVMLNGSDTVNWQNETNLGDLVTDAYKWYAENEFEGFEKDAPVVAIQNG
jgi:5'-nucleotidase